MARFTAKSFDICAVGAQDNTTAINSTIGAAGAAASATLAHDGSNIFYITGFQVTSTNPAATVSGAVTVAGLTQANGGSGTLTYQFVESNTFGGNLSVTFANPIPAKDVNTDIVVTCPIIASGGVVSVSVQGYKRPE